MMIGVLLNAVVLFATVQFLIGDNAPEFFTMFLVALGLAILNGLLVWGLVSAMDLPGLLVAFLLSVPVGMIVLMRFCYLSVGHAAITMFVLVVFRLAFSFFFTAMFSTTPDEQAQLTQFIHVSLPPAS